MTNLVAGAANAPQTVFAGKRNWLTVNVLIPFEDNYKKTFEERAITFWVNFFSENGWTRSEIITTSKRLMLACKFLPTIHDWAEHRPKSHETQPDLRESPADTVDRLARSAHGDSWQRFVMQTARWGLKRGKDHPTRMDIAYDKIISEGHKRDRPDEEITGFRHAKGLLLGMREARAEKGRHVTSKA